MANSIKNVIAVIDYVEAHLNEKLDLDIVANAVHYSKYYLHRVFTSTVGLTIHDYVQRRQLTEAAKLLVFSDQSILEIALIAGYESQQAFTSVFKAMYKKSPNQYREEEEYKENLQQCIYEKRAIILKDENIAIGIMAFCYINGSIEFFGIHPQYRKQGIAIAFLTKIFNELIGQKEINITTFRKGDKADTGYHDVYKNLGFKEAELLIEFGYPTQKFVLQRQLLEDGTNE